ncbi:hypothetical protein [Caldalkalibacillus mannanilyticus]|uniref:hypothetical protein n=1 Tax=Caldalkalibacillus mannanilyticus TaxID=1418 RepID=UPI00046AE442|nr:hypothetical protein [Caldalkalibacillus mannanilyticus]
MSGIHQSFHQDDIFLKIKNKKEKEDHTYGEQLSDKDQTHTNTTNLSEMDESLNSYREQGVQYIYRYSFAIAKQLFPADEIESVQLRVIVTDTVPFSERRNSEYNVHQEYFDFPKQTYQSISAPF